MIAEILDPADREQARAAVRWGAAGLDPLTDSEIRVLRYLPTHLSAPEIARELSVSTKHRQYLPAQPVRKLGAHSRAKRSSLARALGLLAPSVPRR